MKKVINIFLILILFLAVSCNKEITVDCTITSPDNGQEFYNNEDIQVSVAVDDSNGAIKCVHLYIDDKCYSGISNFPYEFTIPAGDLVPEDHVIKVIAQNIEGIKGETSLNIKIIELHYESPDFVSFSDGLMPISWETAGWYIYPTESTIFIPIAVDFSLFTQADNAYVTTTKTCNYIEFYLMGRGIVNLYIDGALWERIEVGSLVWEMSQYWEKYSYGFPEGFHTFKWEYFPTNYGNRIVGLDEILFKSE
jgi:hypothetical protein